MVPLGRIIFLVFGGDFMEEIQGREFTDVVTGDSVLFSEGDDGSEEILVKVSDLVFLFWDGVIVGAA